MGRIKLAGCGSLAESMTDRQERISWWGQKAVHDARILVAGAGAIGNEVIKNLCLIGFGHIFIADMDRISTTNLSRTVLFTADDVGKYKAEVAAERAKEMSVCPDAEIQYFTGDIVHELGTGVFRQFDLVLGCLDNYECRLSVNHRCNQLGIPYIDGGIWELTWSVQVFHFPESSCLACGVSSGMLAEERKRRYSCGTKQLRQIAEEKAPTIQVASASVGALMVQEAAKIVNGQTEYVSYGKKYLYEGMLNRFETVKIRLNDNCLYHDTFDEITETDFTNKVTLKEFLHKVSADHGGKTFFVDILGEYKFTTTAKCRTCGTEISLFQPEYKLYVDDIYCEDCMRQKRFNTKGIRVDSEDLTELRAEDSRLADLTLEQLGIPKGHIITVRNTEDEKECCYYELSADLPEMLGEISLKTDEMKK